MTRRKFLNLDKKIPVINLADPDLALNLDPLAGWPYHEVFLTPELSFNRLLIVLLEESSEPEVPKSFGDFFFSAPPKIQRLVTCPLDNGTSTWFTANTANRNPGTPSGIRLDVREKSCKPSALSTGSFVPWLDNGASTWFTAPTAPTTPTGSKSFVMTAESHLLFFSSEDFRLRRFVEGHEHRVYRFHF